MKKRVAVFPAGSEIGLEINNALKYSTLFEVYGFSSVKCHAEYVYRHYVEGIPFYKDENFIKVINEKLDQYEIDFLYPAYDDIQLFLTRCQDRLHAQVVTSAPETVEICRSKKRTYEFFKEESFVPETYQQPEKITEYPVFFKPDIGQGSQGAKKINTQKELLFALEQEPDAVICEYLPGEEYTVDCFTDKDGMLRVCSMRDRRRIRNGISVCSKALPLPEEIERIAETINSGLDIKGAWFFQVKKNVTGAYRLLEIACRIAGTMGMSRNRGVNYALLTLFTLMDMPVELIRNKYEIEVDRALISRYHTDVVYQYVYVDLDDTLLVGGRVNTELIRFLYQTVNEGKKRILLTKHLKVVADTLKKAKISRELFDEMICIDPEEEKSSYIKEKEAIFIDDSFSERKKVSDKTGVPVFDCSEVEALIDWRV